MNDAQLYTLLTGDSGIAAITDRIYNGDLPEKTPLPAVTFELVSDTPVNTLSGDTGHRRSRYTFNSWAATLAESIQLRDAIRSAMSGYYRLGMLPRHEQEDSVYRFAVDYSIPQQ